MKGEQIDWDELLEVAARFGLTQALKEGLARAAADWEVHTAAGVSSHLETIEPSKVERLVLRDLVLPHSQVQSIYLGLSSLGPGQKLRYFFWQVFPRLLYMRQHYGVRH